MNKKYLFVIGFIVLIGMFVNNESSSAKEMIVDSEINNNEFEQINASTSITHSFTQVFEKRQYMPERIWQSRSGYSGYVYLIRYEYTRNDNFLAFYQGVLYKNVAPLKIVEEE